MPQSPTLVVLDDLDVTEDTATPLIAELLDEIEATPTMVVGSVRDPEASPELARLIERIDSRGDGHLKLDPLDAEGVREIARQYAGDDVQEVPLESISRASGGIPGRVHEVMSEWAEQEATRRLAAAAEFLAAERRSRAADLDFANNVIGPEARPPLCGRSHGRRSEARRVPVQGARPLRGGGCLPVLRP